jgi:hypothetical protein
MISFSRSPPLDIFDHPTHATTRAKLSAFLFVRTEPRLNSSRAQHCKFVRKNAHVTIVHLKHRIVSRRNWSVGSIVNEKVPNGERVTSLLVTPARNCEGSRGTHLLCRASTIGYRVVECIRTKTRNGLRRWALGTEQSSIGGLDENRCYRTAGCGWRCAISSGKRARSVCRCGSRWRRCRRGARLL